MTPRAPMSEEWRRRFSLLRADRLAAGLCERCGLLARPGKLQCARCAEAHSAKALARYHAKRARV